MVAWYGKMRRKRGSAPESFREYAVGASVYGKGQMVAFEQHSRNAVRNAGYARYGC